jgi:penicillin amidase
MGPFQGDSEAARALLAGWDGNLLPDSNVAVLYAHFRRALLRRGLGPLVGDDTLDWLASEAIPASVRILGAWLDTLARAVAGEAEPPPGIDVPSLAESALADAFAAAAADQGPDPAAWRWDSDHATLGVHTLAGAFPDAAQALNPPRAHFGGDGDTVQQGGYGYRDVFDVSYLSVYRQAVDLSVIESAGWIVPGGVSGVPGSPHFSDQLERWRRHALTPMRYTEADVGRDAQHQLRLTPPE